MTVSDFTSLLIWLPIGAAVVVWVLPLSRYATGALFVWLLPLPRNAAGGFALLVGLGEVALWIDAVARFDFGRPGLQLDQRQSWFSDLNVSYHVGMFPFSLWLVGLAAVVMAAAVAYAVWIGRERPRAYFGLMLFLTGAIVGVFTPRTCSSSTRSSRRC